MKIRDIMYETYGSLSSNKARSGLTILGIVLVLRLLSRCWRLDKARRTLSRNGFSQLDQILS
jgi:hypothetical protein